MNILEDDEQGTVSRKQGELLLDDLHGPLLADQIAHDRLQLRISVRVGDRQQRGKEWDRLRKGVGGACKGGFELVEPSIRRVAPLEIRRELELPHDGIEGAVGVIGRAEELD